MIRLFAPWAGARELARIMPLEEAHGTREIARNKGQKLLAVDDKLILTPVEERKGWDDKTLDD